MKTNKVISLKDVVMSLLPKRERGAVYDFRFPDAGNVQVNVQPLVAKWIVRRGRVVTMFWDQDDARKFASSSSTVEELEKPFDFRVELAMPSDVEIQELRDMLSD